MDTKSKHFVWECSWIHDHERSQTWVKILVIHQLLLNHRLMFEMCRYIATAFGSKTTFRYNNTVNTFLLISLKIVSWSMGKVVVVKYYVFFSFLPISYEVTCFRSSCFLQILQEINLICNWFQVINKKKPCI